MPAGVTSRGWIAIMASMLGSVPVLAALPTEKLLPLGTARTMAAAALDRCRADGFAVSVTIVDQHGNLLLFMRGDGSGLHTIESSRRKAHTAMLFKMPSAQLGKLLTAHPEGMDLNRLQDVTTLAGGLPILSGRDVVGGIGIGGGPGGDRDEACARAGLAAVATELN